MGFDPQAEWDWESGRHHEALQRMWTLATRPEASLAIVIQALYYMYCAGTFRPAQEIARMAMPRFHDDPDFVLNSGVIELRMEDHGAARTLFERYLTLGGREESALDGLATAYHALGEEDKAREWGERAIEAKSDRAAEAYPAFALEMPRTEGKDVIAFTLFGDQPRYLRGALQNVLRARVHYPGFTCLFMVDESVPADVLVALEQEGAMLRHHDADTGMLDRLARRFLVADDPAVRRYLVRDADSVVGGREAAAVAEWIEGGLPFHAMRDWWTHTDPLLAGMWGGIGGALPPVAPLIANYRPEHMETGHVDQWFLRDRIWPSIRASTLVHDRCFRTQGSRPFPTSEDGAIDHVGENEFAANPERQATELAEFARTIPSLQL